MNSIDKMNEEYEKEYGTSIHDDIAKFRRIQIKVLFVGAFFNGEKEVYLDLCERIANYHIMLHTGAVGRTVSNRE